MCCAAASEPAERGSRGKAPRQLGAPKHATHVFRCVHPDGVQVVTSRVKLRKKKKKQ